MSQLDHYVIRGGIPGRERLRIVARVLRPTTVALFDRLGVGPGMHCLDCGCGGGDVTLELARRIGPHGRVVGVDIDDTKLDIARLEAAEQGIQTVDFRALDVRTHTADSLFDLVYARFLLTHLDDPARAVAAFFDHVRPGGLVIVEDIDFSGHFTWPDSPASRRYQDWYCAIVRKRGGDPNIGPRLPSLLADAGFRHVDLHVIQPVAFHGDVKLLNPLTMENISDAVLRDGLATREEIDAVVRELYAFAEDPRTLSGAPRIIQSWARRPE